eukprot:14894859-Heterocapsa_arctica.AAC.1
MDDTDMAAAELKKQEDIIDEFLAADHYYDELEPQFPIKDLTMNIDDLYDCDWARAFEKDDVNELMK